MRRNHGRQWFGGLLLAAMLSGVAALLWATPPTTVRSAPLAQATATPTPGPVVCSLGGAPLYCPHAPNGNDLLGVSVEWGNTNIDTGALITAAGATTTQTTADQTNGRGRCVKVVLDMTTVGTGSVTATIQGKDTASGKYYTLLTGAAVTTNSTNVYTVCPGITVAANVAASDVLPRTWRVNVVANNANPVSYSLGASVIN